MTSTNTYPRGICKVTACDRPARAAGLCTAHYRMHRAEHSAQQAAQPMDISAPQAPPVSTALAGKHVPASPEHEPEKLAHLSARSEKEAFGGGGSESDPGKRGAGGDNNAHVQPIEPEKIFPASGKKVLPDSDKSPAQLQAEARNRIRKADPVGFLIDVMHGRPLPILSAEGEIVGYERVDPIGRAAAADRLLKRILPELKAVEMSTGDGGVVFNLTVPFAVPGSARHSQIEANLTPDALQHGLRQMVDAVMEDEGEQE